MEVLTEIGKQSPLLAVFGAVIWWLLSERKALKTELENANKYILLQLKEQTEMEVEIADEKTEELKSSIITLNKVASVLDEHNKLTEYEQRRKKE